MKKKRLIFLIFFIGCICSGYGMEKNDRPINKESIHQKERFTTKKRNINPLPLCVNIKNQDSGENRVLFLVKRDPVDTRKVKKSRTDINFVFKSVNNDTTQEQEPKRKKVACNSRHKYVENYDEIKELALLEKIFKGLVITEKHTFVRQSS